MTLTVSIGQAQELNGREAGLQATPLAGLAGEDVAIACCP